MEVPEVTRLKLLEEDNACLKKPFAEATLDKEALKVALGRNFGRQTRCGKPWKSCVRQRSVATLCLQAGRFVPVYLRYAAQRPSADAHLSGRITELALERRRFDYRRVWQLLRREGLCVNHKRVYRTYHLNGLSVKSRRQPSSNATVAYFG